MTLSHICRRNRGLYTPEVNRQDVPSADQIGIVRVTATDTEELLVLSVLLGDVTTSRTCLGGISRVYIDQANTVLLALMF